MPTFEERRAAERRVVIATVKDLLHAGFSISVFDGEEDALEKSLDQTDILDAMMSTDEDYLYAYKPGEVIPHGWVRLVYGNDGPDVVNDYSSNMEHVLATSLNLAELENERMFG